jgi:hypothetical protein
VLKELDPTSPAPVVYLSHKAREDEIDDVLAEEFQKKGFYGEQVCQI